MTRKTRKTLFFLAIAAFVALGFFVIMYAQGYRWDFNKHRLLLSGAIYVEPLAPEKTDISINPAFAGKGGVNGKITDSQTTASLIKNLLPFRTYQITVAADGYQTWAKELSVEPGLVVEAKNTVLFPQKLNGQIILVNKNLTDFAVSPNQNYIALNTSNKITLDNLADIQNSAPLVFADKIKTNAVGFLKNGQGWSDDSKKFIFWRAVAPYGFQTGRVAWYIWDSATNKIIELNSLYERKIVLKNASSSPLPTKFNPTKVKWLGQDLLALINGRVLRLDITNQTVTDLNLSDIVDFDYQNSKIIALKKPNILLLMDSAVQNVSAVGNINIPAQKVLFSPEGDKVLFASNNTVGVIWLKETSKQPSHKTGDKEIIYPALAGQSGVGDTYWHKFGENIIILDNNQLKAVELDERGERNIAAWSDTISAINYFPENQKLFLLSNGELKQTENKF